MKKIKNLIGVLLLILVVMIAATNCSYAKGKFIELDFFQPYSSQPVAISNKEILFLGDNSGPAQIYNIEENKLIATNSAMSVPRTGYSAIKYNKDNVLIVGGYCKYNRSDCSQVAEVYNIKNKKFTRISNSKFPHIVLRLSNKAIVLNNGNVLIPSNSNNIEIFSPREQKFTEVITTINQFVYPDVMEINDDEVLIYGTPPLRSNPKIKINPQLEVYNFKTKKSVNIEIPAELNTRGLMSGINIGTAVKIDPRTILFIGVGIDHRYVVKFDTYKKELSYYAKLPSGLAGSAILLENDEILFSHGMIAYPEFPDLFFLRPTALVHAIYDYKHNKIYNKKIIRKSVSLVYLIQLSNSIYISESNVAKPTLYKY